MSTATRPRRSPGPGDVITNADLLGEPRRWRRGQAPVPAGTTTNEDGTPDNGIFGPGSTVWDVLLHPATVIFHHAGQQLAQRTYAPIQAGIRDWEPTSRKAMAGTMTAFDVFERLARGAGMHLPLWLGDTPTAKGMADWLHTVHSRVTGAVIDSARPELGGYDAAGPRESMWAALTEMHPMLRVYEAFAFRGLRPPRRLPPALRDRFIAESGAYLRLHGAPEDEIPTSTAELAALYRRYDELFVYSATVDVLPETGENIRDVMAASLQKNLIPSHAKAMLPVVLAILFLGVPVRGALPARSRQALGMGPAASVAAVVSAKAVLPLAWLLQQPPIERRVMRLLWGPDGVVLFQSARRLHAEAKAKNGQRA